MLSITSAHDLHSRVLSEPTAACGGEPESGTGSG